MQQQFIEQFEQLFKISFKNVVDIESIPCDTYDDGIYHYIDLVNKDVYSFDTNDDVWLEKNMYKTEILSVLKID